MNSGLQIPLFSKQNKPNYFSFLLVLSHTLFPRLSSNALDLGFCEELSGMQATYPSQASTATTSLPSNI